ncbi:hypothetical protein LJR066_001197 [Acidovorax sp. LjRoot66]|uniref:hypothetical protein n=1 Tax=Acidovorax sp. LjRoot66 TaxID=3342334 RepID=UPI003ECE9C99
MLHNLHLWFVRLFGDTNEERNSGEPVVQAMGADTSAEARGIDSYTSLGQVFPYDEKLLERSRAQWQFGDWESLSALSRDTLQHHPDRAKLALLVGAGSLRAGKAVEARQFIRLAQDWGVSKKLASQVLAAGVHNTLGRAAAISGDQPRAVAHFASAIAMETPGANSRLLAEARIGQQLPQLGLPASNGSGFAGRASITAPTDSRLPTSIDVLTRTLEQQTLEFDAQLKKQEDELIRVRKFLDSSLKSEIANATKQIEAVVGLQSYFATGELPSINTERHSWPISPDFAIYLIELIEINDYDLIIEFGSGISTVVVAKTIAKMMPKRMGKSPVELVSFDHLDVFYQKSCSHIEQAGLKDIAKIVLAPLKAWEAPNGSTYSYYSCLPTLRALAQKYPKAGLRILVIVDGPPAATGRHARYPAAPLVLEHFAGAHIDFLLDDYVRQDEKEIAQLWQKDIDNAGLTQITTQRRLEKDACLISVK